MKHIYIKLLFPFLLTIVTFNVFTQPPPPAPKSDGDAPRKVYTPPSLKDNFKGFTSLPGRFSVSTPSQLSGYISLSKKNLGYEATGQLYNWRFKEGILAVSFQDSSIFEEIKTENQTVNFFASLRDGAIKRSNYKLISEEQVKLNGKRGYILNYIRSDSTVVLVYVYLDGKRMYNVQGIYTSNTSEIKKLFEKKFATFNILSKESISQIISKEVKEKTKEMNLAPLPQDSSIKRPISDAKMEHIRGNVKQIIEKRDKTSSEERRITSILDFDKKGNYLKRQSFDKRGNPRYIQVYGYIDRARVSKSKNIQYSYNPPSPPPPATTPNKSSKKVKVDSRYEYKYKYEFKDGKLIKTLLVSNTGRLLSTTIYKYKENSIEKLIYTSNGSLNQKYISTFDKNGNEIAETDFDTTDKKYYGDRKYVYAYEFDSKGNWIKKIAQKEIVQNGKTVFTPFYVVYREIEYY